MQSQATTVDAYLSELPDDRRRAISAVRSVILRNLDKDYQEGMSYGMIGYCVPHRVYPAGYHCNPAQALPFVCLASQKNYMSLYLMTITEESADGKWFQQQWAKTGKKLDMGKCCLRFKRIEDISLDIIGEAIRRMPVQRFIAFYETVIKNMRSSGAKKTARPKKSAAKPGAKSAAKKQSPSLRPSKATVKAVKLKSQRAR